MGCRSSKLHPVEEKRPVEGGPTYKAVKTEGEVVGDTPALKPRSGSSVHDAVKRFAVNLWLSNATSTLKTIIAHPAAR